jgi:hypothetical protein
VDRRVGRARLAVSVEVDVDCDDGYLCGTGGVAPRHSGKRGVDRLLNRSVVLDFHVTQCHVQELRILRTLSR